MLDEREVKNTLQVARDEIVSLRQEVDQLRKQVRIVDAFAMALAATPETQGMSVCNVWQIDRLLSQINAPKPDEDIPF